MPDTTQTQPEEHVFLHNHQGTSDKVYPVWLRPKDGGWVVDFQYGRRGSTLKPGTKTKAGPVDYEKAKRIYDKVVAEQLADGYVVIGGAAPVYVQAANGEKERSGLHCQLLNAIGEDEALALNRDPAWFAQEKHDGKRMILEKSGGTVRAINRKGIYVGYPKAFEEAALAVPNDFIIDGEAVGEQLRAFDMLSRDGRDLRQMTAFARLAQLRILLEGVAGSALTVVETAFSEEDKIRLYRRLDDAQREGVVYKRADSVYEAGRPNRGGNQLKRKFYETCSAVAGPVNDKSSVPLRLLRDGDWVSVGNCTIPPNAKIPPAGSVVEVRYLYAYPDGALAQPIYLGPRSDIDPAECLTSQLKLKSAEEVAALEAGSPGPRF